MVDQDYWIGATIAEAAGILNRYAAPPSFEPSTSPSMADSAGSCSATNTDSDSPGASSVVGAASSTGGEVAPSIAGAASSRPANTKARIFSLVTKFHHLHNYSADSASNRVPNRKQSGTPRPRRATQADSAFSWEIAAG